MVRAEPAMNSELEDSDATVAEEPTSGGSDTEGPGDKSPSFLKTQPARYILSMVVAS